MTMLLSEAINLGSTVIAPRMGMLFDAIDNGGCAIGMAEAACGKRTLTMKCQLMFDSSPEAYRKLWAQSEAAKRWPWLLEFNAPSPKCCGSWETNFATLPKVMTVVHIFDSHVMCNPMWLKNQPAPLSLEQLVDYVRTIEPIPTEQSSASIFDREEVAAL